MTLKQLIDSGLLLRVEKSEARAALGTGQEADVLARLAKAHGVEMPAPVEPDAAPAKKGKSK